MVFFLIYHFGGIFFDRIKGVRRILEELSSATTQIKVRAAFTMMLIFVALAEMLGTEIILGAFLAGAIVSLLKRPEDEGLIHQLDAIGYGFFIPIFFIMVGVDFNLASLISSPSTLLLVPALLLSAAAVKLLPSLVLKTDSTGMCLVPCSGFMSLALDHVAPLSSEVLITVAVFPQVAAAESPTNW